MTVSHHQRRPSSLERARIRALRTARSADKTRAGSAGARRREGGWRPERRASHPLSLSHVHHPFTPSMLSLRTVALVSCGLALTGGAAALLEKTDTPPAIFVRPSPARELVFSPPSHGLLTLRATPTAVRLGVVCAGPAPGQPQGGCRRAGGRVALCAGLPAAVPVRRVRWRAPPAATCPPPLASRIHARR